ncbi:MAG: SIMPL domain-containing protein [Anaerolineaceae bacterium]|nr:SIMPL domain-containing protein [Anaerolineaceae bacterium]
MKQKTFSLNIVLVITLLIALAAFIQPKTSVMASRSVAAQTIFNEKSETFCDSSRSIQVSGTAVVNVTPDRVLIQLGIQSNGVTPQIAEAANSSTINNIIKALKAIGIEEKDIVTDYYVIDPVYSSYDSMYIKGYRIHNVVAITLRDISKVNQAIIAALGAGANQVVNVEFYLSDLRKYRDQARELAVIAAKEKAHDLAAAAGAETGCVLNISENSWSYYNGGWFRQNQDLWTQNVIQNVSPSGNQAGALTDAGPLNLGQISVRAEVQASYSLK